MNPSSDNDRFGGGDGLEEEEAFRRSPSLRPQHLHPNQDPQEAQNRLQIHQSHDSAESCAQRSLPSRPRFESDNEHRAHISNSDTLEEQISQLQTNQAHGPANPHHLHQHDPHQHPKPRFASVFRGSDLVDWLVERGLCAGRAEAQLYGVRLQLGGVLDHLTGRRSFRDEPTLLYYFTQGRERGGGEAWSQIM